jgi:hypothetical protein
MCTCGSMFGPYGKYILVESNRSWTFDLVSLPVQMRGFITHCLRSSSIRCHVFLQYVVCHATAGNVPEDLSLDVHSCHHRGYCHVFCLLELQFSLQYFLNWKHAVTGRTYIEYGQKVKLRDTTLPQTLLYRILGDALSVCESQLTFAGDDFS